MDETVDLAGLRGAVRLLDGEVVIDGWAAERERGGLLDCGLVLVTNWRIMFVETGGRLAAFPISKVDYVEYRSPTCVALRAWYDHMLLSFDSQAALAAVVNLLRQDPNWTGVVVDLSRASACQDVAKTQPALATIAP